MFEKYDIHIHIPEGAVPKDGPSAGVTLATAIVSAFTGKLFKNGYAMTGELTLTGRVLAIGGLREKSLAALQSGVTNIFISSENKRNLSDLSETVLKNIKFIIVDDVVDIIKQALMW
jgi:ATP-dependent Lon protease